MADKKNELDEMLNAVGAMAETSAMLYKQLVANDVPPYHAAQITGTYVRGMMGKGGEEE